MGVKAAPHCPEIRHERIPVSMSCISDVQLTLRRGLCRPSLANFFLHEQDIERSIDVVELSFRVIDRVTRDYNYLHLQNADALADEAIEELNGRFKEHSVGYQFIDGEIIRVDSELVHAEVVKPALRLLNQKNYAGAQQEFLKA